MGFISYLLCFGDGFNSYNGNHWFYIGFRLLLSLSFRHCTTIHRLGDHMREYKINMYQVPITKIYRVKQYWSDWLKYRLPIPKKITPVILKNLLGGFK